MVGAAGAILTQAAAASPKGDHGWGDGAGVSPIMQVPQPGRSGSGGGGGSWSEETLSGVADGDTRCAVCFGGSWECGAGLRVVE